MKSEIPDFGLPSAAGWCCSLVLVALAALACGWDPVRKRPELRVTSAPAEERLGQEELVGVRDLVGLVEGDLADYVAGLGARLAAHSPRQNVAYRFYVADLGEPSSFSLPGGHVFVTRGLLMLVNDEAELAALLAHEIGHVAARHAIHQRTSRQSLRIPTELLSAVVGDFSPSSGDKLEASGRRRERTVLHRYAAEHEFTADRVGQELLVVAGFPPDAQVRALGALARADHVWGRIGLRGDRFGPAIPIDPDRIRQSRERAAELASHEPAVAPTPTDSPGTRSRFLRRLVGMRVGPSPTEGLPIGTRYASAVLDLSVRFPEGWQVVNAHRFLRAEPPGGGAAIIVRSFSGDDPDAAARAFESIGAATLLEPPDSITIHDLPAVRAVAFIQRKRLDLTWIAHRGRILMITGVVHETDLLRYEETFFDVAASVRPLRESERREFLDVRLGLVAARDGETLPELLRRSSSLWDVRDAAAVNGLEPSASLEAGAPVKVAVSAPFEVPLGDTGND